MDVEINPEPSDQEREAILAALAAEAGELEQVSAWGQAALASEEDQAVAPPRQSRGATRA